MAHDHGHVHRDLKDDRSRKGLLGALLITATFMLLELVGGYLTNSLALIADAGHMLTDAAALGLVPARS